MQPNRINEPCVNTAVPSQPLIIGALVLHSHFGAGGRDILFERKIKFKKTKTFFAQAQIIKINVN